MYQYHPANPFRPVNWRWEYARIMREKHSRTVAKASRYDRDVLDAHKFQIALNKCCDDIGRWELMDKYPDIYAAYLIFSRGAAEDKHPLRYVIEARILAGQEPKEIADVAGVKTEVIRYYSNIFFDVKDKLNHSDYIMTCVIGPSVYAGLTDRDYDLLWKLFGYIYGPAVLDSFIITTSRRFRPANSGEVDAALADDARSALQRKATVVARTFTVNPFSQTELLNIYARFIEVEKDQNSGKAHDVIMQNIQIMMDKLPWKSGGIEGNEIPDALRDHYQGAVEYRTEEVMAISAGQKIEEIERPTFPELIPHAEQIK